MIYQLFSLNSIESSRCQLIQQLQLFSKHPSCYFNWLPRISELPWLFGLYTKIHQKANRFAFASHSMDLYVQNMNRFMRVFNHWLMKKKIVWTRKIMENYFQRSWKIYKARLRGGSLFDLLTHERITWWWWCWWMFRERICLQTFFFSTGKVLLLSVWRLIGRRWSLLWIFFFHFQAKKKKWIQTMLLSEWWVTFTWSPRCYIFQPQKNYSFLPSQRPSETFTSTFSIINIFHIFIQLISFVIFFLLDNRLGSFLNIQLHFSSSLHSNPSKGEFNLLSSLARSESKNFVFTTWVWKLFIVRLTPTQETNIDCIIYRFVFGHYQDGITRYSSKIFWMSAN